MGYSTDFEGQFDLDKPLSIEHFGVLKALADDEFTEAEWDHFGAAGLDRSYCQWEPTKDRKGIQWDGNEKFYNYQEWLQYIIDKLLLPWGYKLTGQVSFQGEDRDDYGTLRVVNDKAILNQSPVAQWEKLDAMVRTSAIEAIEEAVGAAERLDREVYQAFKAAMALLREGV